MNNCKVGDKVIVTGGDSDYYDIGFKGVVTNTDSTKDGWVDFNGNEWVEGDGVWCVNYSDIELES